MYPLSFAGFFLIAQNYKIFGRHWELIPGGETFFNSVLLKKTYERENASKGGKKAKKEIVKW